MKLLVINGPNINMLGIREPEIYGDKSYDDLINFIKKERGAKHDISFFQSNHEGEIIDAIQEAYHDGIEGIIINPAAYTHTSIAIMDALESVMIPTVEVHISNPKNREEFRKVSYVEMVAEKTFSGYGFEGYIKAIDYLSK